MLAATSDSAASNSKSNHLAVLREPRSVGGALLLTLAGKGQFHSFSRWNHHRDPRRGPRRHSAIRKRSNSWVSRLMASPTWPSSPYHCWPQRVRHPSRMVVALCRRLRIPGNPIFRLSPGVPAAGLVRTLHDLSWYPAISYSKLICLLSRASSFFLIGSPPPKPVRLPSLPMTRWHGMMMGIGFEPFANPTARSALGLPMR